MRRIAVAVAALGLLALAVPAQAKTPKLELSISNFRFCRAQSCTPLDVGYLRTDSGPTGIDNPMGAIDVKRGAIVTWVYRDSFCDMIAGCPGHNVIFENGTLQGAKQGFVPSGSGPKKISVRIKQKVGTMIHYFCSVNSHYQEGMTGILRVVK